MTDYDALDRADMSGLKSQMRQVMGIGEPGRLNQLEERVAQHERGMQRMKGVAGTAGGLLTIAHLAMDYFRRH